MIDGDSPTQAPDDSNDNSSMCLEQDAIVRSADEQQNSGLGLPDIARRLSNLVKERQSEALSSLSSEQTALESELRLLVKRLDAVTNSALSIGASPRSLNRLAASRASLARSRATLLRVRARVGRLSAYENGGRLRPVQQPGELVKTSPQGEDSAEPDR